MVDKHISVTFGRMNPVTTGHAKLINAIQKHAASVGGEHRVFLSHTHDAKKNPLPHKQKVGFVKKMIPTADVHEKDDVKTPIDMLKHLHKKGYSHVHMFVGSDRKQEMSNLAHHYNGKEYNFKHIEVHDAGHRDPDSEGVEGMSASKMRDAAKAKNFKHFSRGVPSKPHAKELFHAVRKGMKLEHYQDHKALFIVGGPGSGKDFIVKGIIAENEIIELPLDKLYKAILAKSNIEELNEGRKVIVNGNADNLEVVTVCKAVLEAMGYDTGMCYVYTTNEESKLRNDTRAFKGVKTISETVRYAKYQSAITNCTQFQESFSTFFDYNNSQNFERVSEAVQNEICSDLVDLGYEIAAFVEGREKPLPQRKDAKPVVGSSEPKREPIIKGYERVRKGSIWVLQPKGGIKREEKDLSAMFENYSASATDDSRGNTDQMATNSPTENPQTVIAKVQKKKKIPGNKQSGIALSSKNMADTGVAEAKKLKAVKPKTGTKGAPQPPDYFDQRLGAVPSGGIGLTSSYEPKKGKTINEIRGMIK